MPNARVCTECGAVVPDGHHYCGRCGARYFDEGSGAANETMFFGAMQAPGRAKLILIRGEGLEGLSYHLNATEHVAGRKQGAILFPEDNYLSPRHASFLYRDNVLYLKDEGSHNGTFLRLRGPRAVADGQEILVGEQLLRIEYLNLKAEYPMREETLMYISPPKDYMFRVTQIVRGGKPGASFCSVNNDVLVGREGCDMNFPDDRHASRKHVRLTWKDGQVVVQDHDSRNGTFIRVSNEERLQHGDYVYFGSELMRVEINV
ncbi:FHA domain-containing protein [Microvenator marinus]|uniref:FHA domain-containing protein n=1 Tax=Microvenator marinus TaxID=2600177 RepID=A0A5B8XLT5_9DELT|nr:FHA domain-containing protein [Microvenator marinus]QED26614.1 FHA domain-containing protein [Microvenator marinus]